MPLSIRNSDAEKLAREVSKISGENLTKTIIHALEEKLERLRGSRKAVNIAEEIMSISKRCSSLPDIDKRSADEILGYDKNEGF